MMCVLCVVEVVGVVVAGGGLLCNEIVPLDVCDVSVVIGGIDL